MDDREPDEVARMDMSPPQPWIHINVKGGPTLLQCFQFIQQLNLVTCIYLYATAPKLQTHSIFKKI